MNKGKQENIRKNNVFLNSISMSKGKPRFQYSILSLVKLELYEVCISGFLPSFRARFPIGQLSDSPNLKSPVVLAIYLAVSTHVGWTARQSPDFLSNPRCLSPF